MRHPFILLASALAILPLGGCYVTAQPVPRAPMEAYQPAYYDDNVVYYDTVGAPFIYVEGGVRYVPPTYVHYDVLVGHYRTHARAYHEWYEREGRRHADRGRPGGHDRDRNHGRDRHGR